MIYQEHEDLGSVSSDNIISGLYKPIVTLYTPANNSYQTTAAQITSPDAAIKESILTTNNKTTSNLTNNDRPRVGRVGETLLSSLSMHRMLNTLFGNNNLSFAKADFLSNCLLVSTLVVSVLNTLLLSFVVKSIQLNDRGFIYGKVSFDENLDSTVFELPTRVAEGKSLSLKSIESYANDRPLILGKLPDSGGKYTLTSIKRDQMSLVHDQALSDSQKRFSETNQKGVESVFLSSAETSFSRGEAIDDVSLSKSNYFSVNLDNISDNQFSTEPKVAALLIRTNLMVLNHIIEKQANLVDLSSKWSLLSSSGPAFQSTKTSSHVNLTNVLDEEDGQKVGHSSEARNENIKPLLILNGKQQSVTLPSKSHLRLNSSSTSGSIILDERLKSSEVTGSLEEDFNIQTRDGNLVCRSKETMKLMSRSAGIKITTSKELALKAASLNLKSTGNLYVQNGIEYFDSLEVDDFEVSGNKVDSYKQDDHNKEDKRIKNILQARTTAAHTNHYLGDSANGNEGNDYALTAYNLVVADGILMAMA